MWYSTFVCLEIVVNTLKEVILKLLDVDWVQTSCKISCRDWNVCTKWYNKKQASLFKKIKNLATELKHLFFLIGQKPTIERGSIATGDGKSVTISVAGGDGFSFRHCLPRQFFHRQKKYVTRSVTNSVVGGDEFHNSVARYSVMSGNSTAAFCCQFRHWYQNSIADKSYFITVSILIWSFFVVNQV